MRDAMEDSAAIDEEDNGENDSAHGLRSVYRQVRGLGYLQLKEYFQKTHFPKMSMDGLKKMNFNCCSILRFFPPPSPDVSGSSTVPHHLVAPLGGGHWDAGHLRVPAPRRGLHRRHLAAAPVRCGAKAAAPPVDEEEEASTPGTAASRACSVACSWTRTPPTPRTTDSSTSPMMCRAMSWPTRTWRTTSCLWATSTEEDDLLCMGSGAATRRGRWCGAWGSASTHTCSSHSPPGGPASVRVHLPQDDGVAHGELEASVVRGSGASLMRSPGESPAPGRQ
jgi:hypothetical protein